MTTPPAEPTRARRDAENASASAAGASSSRASGGGVSRRLLLGASGAAAVVGVANGAAGAVAAQKLGKHAPAKPSEETLQRLSSADGVARHGELPAGLGDEVPAFGNLVAFDLTDAARADTASARRAAIGFLRDINAIAHQAGPDAGADGVGSSGLELYPANLQVTPGFGASLLEACGLADRRPSGFLDLPRFAVDDTLEERLCGGDLMIQLGAEDPMRLSGALQQVLHAAGDRVRLRWARSGFKATRATMTPSNGAPRNLMGQHDGTANPQIATPLWDYTVRCRSDDWMNNGSYLVARNIRIDLSRWYRESLAERDAVIGRATATGAAFGAEHENDPADLNARGADGELMIPATAHMRLANPGTTNGARIFRRPWNWDDGFDTDGNRAAGLLFLAWQNDLARGFIPIQHSLDAGGDALSRYISHIGSAVFAAPAQGGDAYVGQRLLEG